MKINTFYVMIGMIVVAGGWGVYRFYAHPSMASSSDALSANIGLSSGVLGAATDTAADVSSSLATPSYTTAGTGTVENASGAAPAADLTAPTGISVMTSTDSMIAISWGASYDATGVAGYRIFMNGKEIGTASYQRYEAQQLSPATTYTFAVSAYDQGGRSSPLSRAVQLKTRPSPPAVTSSPAISATSTATKAATSSPSLGPDTVAPTVPVGLSAIPVSSSEIDLSWSTSTDNVGVVGYEVFENNIFIATTSVAAYKDTGLMPSSEYTYAVSAYDAADNISVKSADVMTTTLSGSSAQGSTADTTPPTTSITSPAVGVTLSGAVQVSVSASDNAGVVKVELYVDGALNANTTALPYIFSLDTTALSNGSHSLETKAYDAAGNVGTSATVAVTVSNATATGSTTTTITTTTTTTAATTATGAAPGAPTNLAATAVSSSVIDLTWTAPTSSANITGYRVFRDGHPLAKLGDANPVYTDNIDLAAGITYTYTVAAYSGSPTNMSPESSPASATTP
jgi:chitodextrinase